ncbi:MAG: DUF1552 domain-containing protein [Bdellovibrionales bacterium]
MSKNRSQLTRRDLIKRFGVTAFLLHPVLRSMEVAAATPFAGAPRFVMFFKGGSFYPSRTNPSSLGDLSGTPIAPLQAHSSDIILFKNMSIHGGSPKTSGYSEEHGAGLFGCVTGNTVHYTKNDSYYAYTNNESIDIRIARHYASRADLQGLPFSSLHVGGGAHSDADSVGLGQRYISFRDRMAGDTTYGNAIEPIQSAGQVYDTLMGRIQLICSGMSNQPGADLQKQLAVLQRKKSLLDFKLADIADAKRQFGMDSEHARKLDGLAEGWRQAEKLVSDQISAIGSGGGSGSKVCPNLTKPTGNGANKQNLDQLSVVHDQMTAMIKLAFEWDLTRVVAFTLSGASSGQTLPSRGISKAHHSLEHNGDVNGLVTIDTYYAEKFAGLLASLKAIDDGGGRSGLFNSSVILGMECWSNSSSGHYLTNIPFVFAGQGGGQFQTGRIVDAAKRSNNDLHLSCMKAAGITDSTFGLASLCKGAII